MSTPAVHTEPEVAAELDARYGRTRSLSRRTRIIAIAAGASIALVFLAWAVWGGLFTVTSVVEYRDASHVVVSDSEVEIGWELTVPAGADAQCALQALNSSYTVVGWKIVSIPGSSDRTRSFTDTVRTSEPAVTGFIYRCWLG